MSTPINDGGPAFPCKREYQHGGGTGIEHLEGMSLLDWFAGLAMQGQMTIVDERRCPTERLKEVEKWRDEILAFDCEFSYRVAKAMLEARKKS